MEFLNYKRVSNIILDDREVTPEISQPLYDKGIEFLDAHYEEALKGENLDLVLDCLESIFDINLHLIITDPKNISFYEKFDNLASVIKNKFNNLETYQTYSFISKLNLANACQLFDKKQVEKRLMDIVQFVDPSKFCKDYKLAEQLRFSMLLTLLDLSGDDANKGFVFTTGLELIRHALPALKFLPEKTYFSLAREAYDDFSIYCLTSHTDYSIGMYAGNMAIEYFKKLDSFGTNVNDCIGLAQTIFVMIVYSYQSAYFNIVLRLYQFFYDFIKRKKIMSNSTIMSLRRKLNRLVNDRIFDKCVKNVDVDVLYQTIILPGQARVQTFNDQPTIELENSVKALEPKIEQMLLNTDNEAISTLVADFYDAFAQYLARFYLEDKEKFRPYFIKSAKIFYNNGVVYDDVNARMKGLFSLSFLATLLGKGSLTPSSAPVYQGIIKAVFKELDTDDESIIIFACEIIYHYASLLMTNGDFKQPLDLLVNLLDDIYHSKIKMETLLFPEFLNGMLNEKFILVLLHYAMCLQINKNYNEAKAVYKQICDIFDGAIESGHSESEIDSIAYGYYEFSKSQISSISKEAIKHLENCVSILKNNFDEDDLISRASVLLIKEEAERQIDVLTNFADEA